LPYHSRALNIGTFPPISKEIGGTIRKAINFELEEKLDRSILPKKAGYPKKKELK
jgi:hypothetical protein|tara:strand:+ start:318 stop:482 length:165 start_codon:yes stop_codon:yes gene_type:complete